MEKQFRHNSLSVKAINQRKDKHMTRFYRFISADELHTILAKSFTNDVIASEDSAMVHNC